MKEKNIHKDEIDWLILVYNTSVDEELRNESYEKLITYGLSHKQIKEKFDKIQSEKEELKNFEKVWKIQAGRNKFKKFSLFEKVKIFFFGPYELFKFFDSGLKDLWDLNYKIKYRQRLILLILGTIFWILFIVGTFKYYEHKRMQEIDEIDVSDWNKD